MSLYSDNIKKGISIEVGLNGDMRTGKGESKISKNREDSSRKEPRVLISGFLLLLGLLAFWILGHRTPVSPTWFSLNISVFLESSSPCREAWLLSLYVCLRRPVLESQVVKIRLFISGFGPCISGFPWIPALSMPSRGRRGSWRFRWSQAWSVHLFWHTGFPF